MTRTDALCRLLKAGGVLAAGAWGLRRRALPRLTILAYHRVVERRPRDYPLDSGVLSCTRAEFEREMEFVARHFEPLTFADLAAGGWERRRPLIVTFDDGYKDNHDLALPVLRRYGVPATFFVTSGYLDERILPWWDEAAWRVRHARAGALRLGPEAGGETLPVAGPEQQRQAQQRLLRLAKALPDEARRRLLEDLRAQSDPPPRALAEGLMMTWDDVRRLVAAGMEIGSHTQSHPLLERVAEAAALDAELAGARRRIEEQSGAAVMALAYPVGRAGAVTEALAQRVRAAGYRYACLYEHGVNPRRGFDPYRLRRIQAEVGTDFDRFRAKVLFPRWVRY